MLLPALVFGAVASWRAVQGQQAAAEARLRDTARALALAVDRELGRQAAALAAFAAHPAFGPDPSSPDLAALDRHARSMAQRLGQQMFVAREDGQLILSTRLPLGARLPRTTAQDLIDRVFTTGRPAVSDLMVGAISGAKLLTVGVPVPDPRGGVALTAGAAVQTEQLRDLLAAQGLPEGSFASVADTRQMIVARSDATHEKVVGRHIPAEAVPKYLGREEGIYRAIPLEGTESVIAFRAVPNAPGWTIFVAEPAARFDAAWRGPLLALLAGGSLAILIGAGLAALAARAILVPLRRLEAHAQALAEDGNLARASSAAAIPTARIAELEMLRRGFAEAEAALASRETELQALFRASPVGIVRADTGGRVHGANNAFLAIIGMDRETLAAGEVRWDELTPPEGLVADERAITEAVTAPDGRCRPYEKEYVRRDGTRVPVLLSFAMLDRATGMVACFVVDLTELRRGEEAQRRAAERRALLLEVTRLALEGRLDEAALATSIFRKVAPQLDAGLAFNYAVDAAEGTMRFVAGLGVPEERLEGVRSLEMGQAFCGHVASTGLPLLADAARIEREEGAAFLRSVGARAYTCHPILGRDGEMLGTFSLASTRRDHFEEEDVVFLQAVCDVIALAWQRRRAEATLRESETRFRALVEASAEAVWTCDAEGATHEPSPSWCALTGQSHAEWLGWGWLDAVHPEDREGMIAHWRRCLAERRPYVTEYRLRHRSGGYRWTQARATPLLAEDGSVTGWIGMNADITGRREAQAVLERSHEELERLVEARTRDLEDTQGRLAHAERMQALGQLAGGIAHDFNNVLQAVQGGASLIQRRAEEPEGVRRHARLILDAAARDAAITRRLLSFSRRGDLRTEPVSPIDLLAGMREVLTHTLGTGIGIRVEAPPGLPLLTADKAQLETVLVNLATNGRDAMEGSGTLTLSAALDIRGEDGTVPLNPGPYIRLAVTDDGAGMPPEVLARVTEPFFTTKGTGKGTGLGLAMARGFAEQSGGGLHIESSPGRGTRVTLWLPLAPGPASAEAQDEEGLPGMPARKVRVLLVDDDPIVREITAEELRAEGFTVLPLAEGEAAIRLLDEGERVGILVSDLSMPGMDGLSVIREAQRRRPELPAILLTGYATKAAEHAMEDAGGGSFTLLRKPTSGPQIAACIGALLDKAIAAGD